MNEYHATEPVRLNFFLVGTGFKGIGILPAIFTIQFFGVVDSHRAIIHDELWCIRITMRPRYQEQRKQK